MEQLRKLFFKAPESKALAVNLNSSYTTLLEPENPQVLPASFFNSKKQAGADGFIDTRPDAKRKHQTSIATDEKMAIPFHALEEGMLKKDYFDAKTTTTTEKIYTKRTKPIHKFTYAQKKHLEAAGLKLHRTLPNTITRTSIFPILWLGCLIAITPSVLGSIIYTNEANAADDTLYEFQSMLNATCMQIFHATELPGSGTCQYGNHNYSQEFNEVCIPLLERYCDLSGKEIGYIVGSIVSGFGSIILPCLISNYNFSYSLSKHNEFMLRQLGLSPHDGETDQQYGDRLVAAVGNATFHRAYNGLYNFLLAFVKTKRHTENALNKAPSSPLFEPQLLRTIFSLADTRPDKASFWGKPSDRRNITSITTDPDLELEEEALDLLRCN